MSTLTLKRSKKDALLDWMILKGTFATHEVMEWGVRNFYDRADRTKRNLLESGIIRKLTEEEKERRGFRCKDAVYAVNRGMIQRHAPDLAAGRTILAEVGSSIFSNQDEQTKKIMEDLTV